MIPSHGRPELLAGALDTLAGEPRVSTVDRVGASRARNTGWRATRADVVAFTDDDCRPWPGWTACLASAFADPSVGVVVGRVVGDGGRGPALSLLDEPAARPLRVADGPATWGHAANLAVRRAAFEQVGGFDEQLGAGTLLHGSEDKDLVLRMLLAGWAGRYEPAAAVVHLQWRGRLAALRTSFGYGVGEGALAAKWRQLLPAPAAVVRASLRQAGHDLRGGYQFGAVASMLRAAGALIGAARARRAGLSASGKGGGGALGNEDDGADTVRKQRTGPHSRNDGAGGDAAHGGRTTESEHDRGRDGATRGRTSASEQDDRGGGS